MLLGFKYFPHLLEQKLDTFLPKLVQKQTWETMCAGMSDKTVLTPPATQKTEKQGEGEGTRRNGDLSLVCDLTSCSQRFLVF